MANEAVIIDLLGNGGDPVRFSVADASAIEKGTICSLVDPRTISGSNVIGSKIVGIAAAEKVALDGSTTLAVYTNGIFDLTSVGAAGAEGAIQAGDLVEVSGSNLIRRFSGANLALDAGALTRVVGTALETASAGEVIAVKVGSYI